MYCLFVDYGKYLGLVVIKIYVKRALMWFNVSRICVNREVRKSQLFFVILSDKVANFCVISREIAKIMGIWRE